MVVSRRWSKAAKAEGKLTLIADPLTWANYGKEISTFEKKYGIKITDEDQSDTSAQEIEAIKQDKGRSSAPDAVDVGESFSVESALFSPYKVQTWKQHPGGRQGRKRRLVQRLRRIHLVRLRHDRRQDLPDDRGRRSRTRSTRVT